MQHVSAFGYPTPPASPSFDQNCAPLPTSFQPQQPCPSRYVPVAPEERLGRFLTSTLRLTAILGTGAYGVVYAAVDVQTKVQYAVKCLSKFNPDGTPLDRRQVVFQTREIRLHSRASAHPNVVSILKIIEYIDCIYVILEYCPEGDLFYNITECGQYVGKDELVKRVFLQIIAAVDYCHSLGVYHRDLKPENILVTDGGETVKLADFGLATANKRSDDYGCGSTFYMSPECLDHASRRPFYYSAPNDVWSLGVVLVNLTCGRNPWKQASAEDPTYRAYTRCPDFLKTILPVSDELNDILGRIFTIDPEQRIKLPELRDRILQCSTLTAQPASMLTPPASPEQVPTYGDYEAMDDDSDSDSDSDSSLSDVESMSDDDSVCSDASSPPSSVADDEDFEDLPEAKTPPPTSPFTYPGPAIYGHDDPRIVPFPQDYMAPCHAPLPDPIHLMALSAASPCAQKYQLPYTWDSSKFAQPAPQLHHPVPFHHQVPRFASTGGFC